MNFIGFPSGKLRVTPLPDLFFSELLPQIDDLAELKLSLHVYWRLAHRQSPLCLSLSELRGDALLRRSLDGQGLEDALARAARRGTLIEVLMQDPAGAVEHWYFANTPGGRREAARARAGKLPLGGSAARAAPAAARERPNIFALYEQHIGMLTPLVAEQLKEASQTYAPQWVEEAFGIAALREKRSWRYVEAILQRWAREGRSTDKVRR